GGEVMINDADASSTDVEPPIGRAGETNPNPAEPVSEPRLPAVDARTTPAGAGTPTVTLPESRLPAEAGCDGSAKTNPNPAGPLTMISREPGQGPRPGAPNDAEPVVSRAVEPVPSARPDARPAGGGSRPGRCPRSSSGPWRNWLGGGRRPSDRRL